MDASFARRQEIHDELHHGFLFLRLGFCYHHHHCHQRVVRQHLLPVAEQQPVPLQEVQEHGSGNALVAIGERVVFGDKVE